MEQRSIISWGYQEGTPKTSMHFHQCHANRKYYLIFMHPVSLVSFPVCPCTSHLQSTCSWHQLMGWMVVLLSRQKVLLVHDELLQLPLFQPPMSGRQLWDSKMKHSGLEVRKNPTTEISIAASFTMKHTHHHRILQGKTKSKWNFHYGTLRWSTVGWKCWKFGKAQP